MTKVKVKKDIKKKEVNKKTEMKDIEYIHLNREDYAACEVDKGIKKEDRRFHSLTKKKNMVSCPDCQKLC